jgi:hypothetical protein
VITSLALKVMGIASVETLRYAAGLAPADARHRDLVMAISEDFARLAREG